MKRNIVLSTILMSSLLLASTAYADTSKVQPCTKKVTVTADDAELYKDSKLNESQTAKKGNVYEVDGYRVINKRNYYRVYQDKKYKGYLYDKSTKDFVAQKVATSDKFYTDANKVLWNNFYWNSKRAQTKAGEVFFKKYEYTLGDGKKYASVYKKDSENRDQWCGYLYSNSLKPLSATRVVSTARGTKEDGVIYRDLYLNPSKEKITRGEKYRVERYYELNHKRYYSIYRVTDDGKTWLGYTPEDNLNLVASPDNKDEVNQAYMQGTDTGATLLPAKIKKVDTVTENTVRGVDLTTYQAEKEAGVTYKNYQGKTLSPNELMAFLKENGINYINLKVAVDPYDSKGNTYGGGQPTLENAIKTAKLAKAAGLHVNINLLFSDFYTSKDNQKLPKGWTKDNLEQKATDYTKATMELLNDIHPDMITVGSNMNDNFLSQPTDKANELLAKVTHIIHEKDEKAKIALSYANPYKDWYWQITDRLIKAKVTFDVIGADIFPAWNKIEDIKGAKDSVNQLNKKFMITSVSYPFTDQDSDGHNNGNTASDITSQKVGSVSPQGQASYMRKLYAAITPNNNDGGAGAFYDNALWIAVKAGSKVHADDNKAMNEKYGTGWATSAAGDYVDGAKEYAGANAVDNQALFDDLGQPLQSLSLFKQLLSGKEGIDDQLPAEDPFETGSETGLKNQKATVKKVANMAPNTMRGVDISSYQALKEAGVKFYDDNGKEESLLKVLHDHGVNYIRLRLWNDPYADRDFDYKYNNQTFHIKKGDCYGGGNTDLQHMLAIGKEAVKYNMKVLLDFHYSDFWADPAQQILPKAWKGKNDKELQQAVYQYTTDVIKTFKDNNIDIGMVQVGNEITYGFMGICANRDIGEDWRTIWKNKEDSSRINQYLKAGIKAVREQTPNALVALHLETPDVERYQTIMDTWKRDHVDYDVLGSSYYPFWNQGVKDLNRVQALTERYGKYFAVLETAWVNTLSEGDGTPNSIGENHDVSAFGVGVQSQVNELTSVYDNVMKEANGLGAFYWEPAWLPVKPGWKNWEYNQKIADEKGTGWASKGALGYFNDRKMFYNGKPAWGGSSWDNQALFDPHGYPLQSLNFYKDSIAESNEQSNIKVVFKSGDKEVHDPQFIRIAKGDSKTITVPEIKGYVTNQPNITIKGNRDYQTVTVSYNKATAIQQYVTVAKSNYKVWADLDYSKVAMDNAYHHTFKAKEKITQGQNEYYTLYNQQDQRIGYINSDALKQGKGEQGAGFACDRLVTLTSPNYKVLKNFKWENQTLQGQNRIFTAKYEYYHMNESTYLSLYNMDGDWIGYINAKGTGKAAISDLTSMNKSMVTTKDTALYNNSHLETKKTVKAKTRYDVKGKRTINKVVYYKVYQNGKYQGYISANAMK